MQHETNQEIISAVGHGRRELGWDEWFGDIEGAQYLTDCGKQAARRAIADLTTFFGTGWLSRATDPGLAGAAIPTLSGYAPLFAWNEAQRPRRYVESIQWWASIQTLVAAAVEGLVAVRRDARNDLSTHRLVHTLTQARLASIGIYLGADVALEPAKSRGPGDVLIKDRSYDIFLEVVTFGPDENRELQERYQQRHFLHLAGRKAAPSIYWEGDIPGFLNKTEEAAWIKATTDGADRCALTGKPVEIPGRNGTCLVMRPGTAPRGTKTTGPLVESDDGTRLARILDRKGAQTRGAGLAWVWVEDFGGMHPVSTFTGMSTEAKLGALADLAGPVLADRVHLAGVAWSAARWCSPVPSDEQEESLSGIALRRGLPIERVRQSIIVNRRLILPAQTSQMVRICDAEPRWLDWALARLGITGGVGALLNLPSPAVKSRLWIP